MAGFWIRLVADVLDALLLTAVGWGIYLAAPTWVHGLGDDAVFVGLAIATLYTATLSSRIGAGQTLAKRVLKLQVLGVDGRALPPLKAALRSLMVSFVFYLSAFEVLFARPWPAVAGVVVIKLLSVLWLGTVFGLVCFTALHPAKRGLHDLLMGSVVIHKRSGFDPKAFAALNVWLPTRKWRAAWWALGVLLVGGVAGVFTGATRERTEVERAQHHAWKVMERDPALRVINLKITVRTVKNVTRGESRSTAVVAVTAKPPGLSEPVRVNDPIIDQLFQATRDNLPPNLGADVLQVSVITGFNLGIAKRLTTTDFVEGYADPGIRRQVGLSTRF